MCIWWLKKHTQLDTVICITTGKKSEGLVNLQPAADNTFPSWTKNSAVQAQCRLPHPLVTTCSDFLLIWSKSGYFCMESSGGGAVHAPYLSLSLPTTARMGTKLWKYFTPMCSELQSLWITYPSRLPLRLHYNSNYIQLTVGLDHVLSNCMLFCWRHHCTHWQIQGGESKIHLNPKSLNFDRFSKENTFFSILGPVGSCLLNNRFRSTTDVI